MPPRWDILGIGSAAVDDVLAVDHFPQPDEKIPVQRQTRRAGGQTATALVAAARHGARTAFCNALGGDERSRFLLAELERAGVDCSMRVEPGSPPISAMVIVENNSGTRTILYNMRDFHEPDTAGILPEWVADCRVVFVDQNTPRSGLHATRLAHAQGIPVIVDIEKVDTPDQRELFAEADHLVVNLGFAREFTGLSPAAEVLRALLNPARAACVLTDGSRGCWVGEPGLPPVHLPPHAVTVRDTTGCGDIFHGVYAAAIARGERVDQAAALANAAAALSAANGGGWGGIPTLAETRQFLSNK